MAGVSKKVGDPSADDAATDVSAGSGTEVSDEAGTDISQRRIVRDDRSAAHYCLTLFISAAIAIIVMICLLAFMKSLMASALLPIEHGSNR